MIFCNIVNTNGPVPTFFLRKAEVAALRTLKSKESETWHLDFRQGAAYASNMYAFVRVKFAKAEVNDDGLVIALPVKKIDDDVVKRMTANDYLVLCEAIKHTSVTASVLKRPSKTWVPCEGMSGENDIAPHIVTQKTVDGDEDPPRTIEQLEKAMCWYDNDDSGYGALKTCTFSAKLLDTVNKVFKITKDHRVDCYPPVCANESMLMIMHDANDECTWRFVLSPLVVRV